MPVKPTDLSGRVFGQLQALSRVKRDRHAAGPRNVVWHCLCSCGAETTARSDKLLSGRTVTCGDHSRHPPPYRHALTYGSWRGMLWRCHDPRGKNWRLYGSRGVEVCERWTGRGGFENFFSDMGPRPSAQHSIDRLDNNKGYEPGNCRWATRIEQRRNQRKSLFLEIDGERVSLAEFCEKTGRDYSVVAGRLKIGWSQEDAISRPVRQKAKSTGEKKGSSDAQSELERIRALNRDRQARWRMKKRKLK